MMNLLPGLKKSGFLSGDVPMLLFLTVSGGAGAAAAVSVDESCRCCSTNGTRMRFVCSRKFLCCRIASTSSNNIHAVTSYKRMLYSNCKKRGREILRAQIQILKQVTNSNITVVKTGRHQMFVDEQFKTTDIMKFTAVQCHAHYRQHVAPKSTQLLRVGCVFLLFFLVRGCE